MSNKRIKSLFTKPCVRFNTPKGCSLGDKCTFVHTPMSDAPVEPVSPILSYHATVSRRLGDGSVFYPEQRLSRLDALRTYTLNAAYAAFEEDLKGSLTPGKLADIAVLSRNILTVPESEIPGTEVLYTVVGGRVMYRR